MSGFCGDMGAVALGAASKEALPNKIKCEDVQHIFEQVRKYDKMKALKKLIEENDGKRVLVYVKTKRTADFIAVMLSEQQKKITCVHGGRLQSDKELARQTFMSGQHKILVATAAAVCGPDIKDVDLVVNYDLPMSVKEYMHRVGRTRRVGHRGKCISFVDVGQDFKLTADVERVLRPADQSLPDFAFGGAATCQVNDAVAVPPEVSAAHQLRRPAACCPPTNGAPQLLMTPHGPLVYWCCFRSECASYGV